MMDIFKCTTREITKRLRREGWTEIQNMGTDHCRFWSHPHKKDIIQVNPAYMKKPDRVACFIKAGWGVPRKQSIADFQRENQRLVVENDDLRRSMLELLDKVDRMVGKDVQPSPGLCGCGQQAVEGDVKCIDCMAAEKAREHHASLFPQLRACR